MQKEEDSFAVFSLSVYLFSNIQKSNLLQEEMSNLKGNEPAESRDGDQGDQGPCVIHPFHFQFRKKMKFYFFCVIYQFVSVSF